VDLVLKPGWSGVKRKVEFAAKEYRVRHDAQVKYSLFANIYNNNAKTLGYYKVIINNNHVH
jgi:hypothetical protein